MNSHGQIRKQAARSTVFCPIWWQANRSTSSMGRSSTDCVTARGGSMAAPASIALATLSSGRLAALVQQNAAELVGLWPDAPWGIYSAGLGRRDIGAQLLFASIQSIHKKAYKLPRRVDMVLIDEAHMIPRNADTMYGKFLADLRTINPALKIVGLNAPRSGLVVSASWAFGWGAPRAFVAGPWCRTGRLRGFRFP